MTYLAGGAAETDAGALTLVLDTNCGISLHGNSAKAFKIKKKNCIALGGGLRELGQPEQGSHKRLTTVSVRARRVS